MADSNSINLALSVIDRINNVKRSLRSVAESTRAVLSEIDSLLVNTEKKAILVDGLAGLSADANALKTEKDSLAAIAQSVLDGVPELTK